MPAQVYFLVFSESRTSRPRPVLCVFFRLCCHRFVVFIQPLGLSVGRTLPRPAVAGSSLKDDTVEV